MGKKSLKDMEKQQDNFLKGAEKKGVPEEVAEQIFAEIGQIAAAPSAARRLLRHGRLPDGVPQGQLPRQYLAALMGAYVDNTDKIVATIEECGRLGVTVLPRASTSRRRTSPCSKDTIRFELLAIKNVGRAPIEAILAARTKAGAFTSLDDFCGRVFAEGLTSKSVIEMLVKAGAFQLIAPNRRSLVEALEDCAAAARRRARKIGGPRRCSGTQKAGGGAPGRHQAAPRGAGGQGTRLPRGELLAMERAAGLVPVGAPRGTLRARDAAQVSRPAQRRPRAGGPQPNQEGDGGRLGGGGRTHYTKKGEPMLFVTLEDTTGSVARDLLPRGHPQYAPLLIKDAVIHQGQSLAPQAHRRGRRERARRAVAQVEVLATRCGRSCPTPWPRRRARAPSASGWTNRRAPCCAWSAIPSPRWRLAGLRLDTALGELKIKSPLLVDPDEGLLERSAPDAGRRPCRVWVG